MNAGYLVMKHYVEDGNSSGVWKIYEDVKVPLCYFEKEEDAIQFMKNYTDIHFDNMYCKEDVFDEKYKVRRFITGIVPDGRHVQRSAFIRLYIEVVPYEGFKEVSND